MSTPSSSETLACKAIRRFAATSNPDVSKICEPMCECSPSSSQLGRFVDPGNGFEGRAGGDREAELLVLVRGRDVLVGVRLDAGGDPDHHRCDHAALGGQLDQPGDLVLGVDDDPADAGVQRAGQLRLGLVVAVEPEPRRVGARPQRDGQLTAGADVEVEPLLHHPADDRRTEEGLAGVVDVEVLEALLERPRPGAEVVLVQHVRRAAVLGDAARARRRRRPRARRRRSSWRSSTTAA